MSFPPRPTAPAGLCMTLPDPARRPSGADARAREGAEAAARAGQLHPLSAPLLRPRSRASKRRSTTPVRARRTGRGGSLTEHADERSGSPAPAAGRRHVNGRPTRRLSPIDPGGRPSRHVAFLRPSGSSEPPASILLQDVRPGIVHAPRDGREAAVPRPAAGHRPRRPASWQAAEHLQNQAPRRRSPRPRPRPPSRLPALVRPRRRRVGSGCRCRWRRSCCRRPRLEAASCMRLGRLASDYRAQVRRRLPRPSSRTPCR